MNRLNLIGQRFGKLTVVSEAPRTVEKRGQYWLCKCDCGGERIENTQNLRRGSALNCGCEFAGKSRPPLLQVSLCRHCKHADSEKNRCIKQARPFMSTDRHRKHCDDFLVGPKDAITGAKHDVINCLSCGKEIYAVPKKEAPLYCPDCIEEAHNRVNAILENLNPQGVEYLIEGIITRAREDYIQGELSQRLSIKTSEPWQFRHDDAAAFFKSKWCAELIGEADINSPLILKMLDREIERRWRDGRID